MGLNPAGRTLPAETRDETANATSRLAGRDGSTDPLASRAYLIRAPEFFARAMCYGSDRRRFDEEVDWWF